MKSFEIQRYRDGAWATDSIYDDRQLAEMEARRMEESSRYGSLRIVEKFYNDQTQKTPFRTIYRDIQFREKVTQKTKTSIQNKKDRSANGNQGELHGRQARTAKAPPKIHKIIINLGLIGLLGIAAMWGRQYYSQLGSILP